MKLIWKDASIYKCEVFLSVDIEVNLYKVYFSNHDARRHDMIITIDNIKQL